MPNIKLGSVSYPYLAVALHYDIPYRHVLAFVEWLENIEADTLFSLVQWEDTAYLAYRKEMERRKNARAG